MPPSYDLPSGCNYGIYSIYDIEILSGICNFRLGEYNQCPTFCPYFCVRNQEKNVILEILYPSSELFDSLLQEVLLVINPLVQIFETRSKLEKNICQPYHWLLQLISNDFQLLSDNWCLSSLQIYPEFFAMGINTEVSRQASGFYTL